MAYELTDNMLSGAEDAGELFVSVLDHFLDLAWDHELPLRVPCEKSGAFDDPSGAGLHHLPELFFQLQGVTAFETPAENFRLMPDQLAVIPPLVAHKEKAMRWAGKNFANIVVMLTRSAVSLHLAGSDERGTPSGRFRRIYTSKYYDRILVCLGDAVTCCRDDGGPASSRIVAGSMQAALGFLRQTLDFPVKFTGHEHPKIALCRSIIATHLSNPDLNVQELARRVGCSADYLSNLFSSHTGTRLSEWLLDQRLEKVGQLLRESSLNISEIAWATGFRDPAYLARCFRKSTGMSPRQYRAEHVE